MSLANYRINNLRPARYHSMMDDMYSSSVVSSMMSALESAGIDLSKYADAAYNDCVEDNFLDKAQEDEMSLDSAMNGMFGNMFSRLGKGMCRLGLNGQMAVKTTNGYKTYDVKTGRLTNVTQFCFDIGQEFFFVVPTTKAKTGDILLIDGKPKCVIENNNNKTIKVMDYENSAIQEIVPERHFFMGQMFFYQKIVSMFGSNNFLKKGKGISGMMGMMFKMNMLKSFTGGDTFGSDGNGMNSLMGMMLMNNMFGKDGDTDLSEMFDFDFEEADFDPTDDSEETPEEKKARLKAELAELEANEKKA